MYGVKKRNFLSGLGVWLQSRKYVKTSSLMLHEVITFIHLDLYPSFHQTKNYSFLFLYFEHIVRKSYEVSRDKKERKRFGQLRRLILFDLKRI